MNYPPMIVLFRMIVTVVRIEMERSRDGVLMIQTQRKPLHLENTMGHFCQGSHEQRVSVLDDVKGVCYGIRR